MEFEYKDYKGKRIFDGDEYFIVEDENGFHAVHAEEMQQYMIDNYDDERLVTDDFEHFKEILVIHYEIYSEILGVI